MFTKKPPKPDLELANQIAGWMTYEELTWLAEQARDHLRIVEIGSYMGRSTRALADHTPGFVAAIDDFKGPRDMSLPKFMREDLVETFVWAMRDLLQMGKVRLVVADHAEAEVDFTPDMVFIDGSHEYADVVRDIRKWAPQVVEGGLLCGHDYTNMAPVRQAVDELVRDPKVVPGTSIWYAIN